MRIQRLTLSGFKSFIDTTELAVEPGLTGVVGPNGCGKSNLVDALRWVMGETSSKEMRGAGMDDVIFNGTDDRAPRNIAEVSLLLDNSARRAPAALNDADELAISRRIEREAGSTYRINGREVRARDVQLLFADAATGAHSPAMVGQGRIGAIINAKPTDRRALLEEAAGIIGLHSRRHEAELKLGAAENNLLRLADVVQAHENQLQAVKRQARQAHRYRRLAEQIRRLTANLFALRADAAEQDVAATARALTEAEGTVAEATRAAANASTQHLQASEGLPERRQREAAAAAKLQRLTVAREALETEERRLTQATESLAHRLAQIAADLARESGLASDAEAALAGIAEELARLRAERTGEAAERQAAEARLAAERQGLAAVEAEAMRLAEEIATATARRDGLAARVEDALRRLHRLAERERELNLERARLQAETSADQRLQEAAGRLAASETSAEACRQTLESAEARQAQCDKTLGERRGTLQTLENEAARIAGEVRALTDLLATDTGELWPPVIDQLQVAPGFEAALGAALGDDLSVPADIAAPVHWRELPPLDGPPALPAGAEPLSRFVVAPAALARRLAQIGVVAEAEGEMLRGLLRPGQRLVSRGGALWRWDGFTVAAGAESALALRLRQRNRLAELRAVEAEQTGERQRARAEFEAARKLVDEARTGVEATRERLRAAERVVQAERRQAAEAERQAGERSSRLAATERSLGELTADLAEAAQARAQAAEALAGEPPDAPARQRLAELRERVTQARNAMAVALAALERQARAAEARAERLQQLTREDAAWHQRREAARTQIAALGERQRAGLTEQRELATRPALLARQRDELFVALTAAEAERAQAADRLAEAETETARLAKAERETGQALAAAREARIRAEAAQEAAAARQREVSRQCQEALGTTPDGALAAAGMQAEDELPDLSETEARLERLKREREAMGPVNLRAEQEAQELEEQLNTLLAERADLEAAIARLRQGIGSLNREGRERLLAAFQQVDGHFQRLFGRLFGGGQAHLSLADAEDPLQAGLEIMASPPGKRLQTLSLLSGGEKALTAMALLFAVFLTNPAPLCVLDEVDAPLDDANVERFCNLLEEIARLTGTRFLVITHNAFTMARMHRLYGVTMVERGVSQLVSVDLARAERMVAAE
ncbi:MAG: hypothetical protein FJX68_14175 [Alphaproteobacteria bacterium]|nr:hypothetical protein [Alphaproteobacteria bacterium]